jgi:hypothetical protein
MMTSHDVDDYMFAMDTSHRKFIIWSAIGANLFSFFLMVGNPHHAHFQSNRFIQETRTTIR